MKRSLEQAWREHAWREHAWREMSIDLDEVLDLERLENDDFLARELPSVLAVNTTLVGRRLGSYTVDRAIGQGGMGTVWLAHRSDGRFEAEVAIKLLNAGLLGAVARIASSAKDTCWRSSSVPTSRG